MLYPIIINPVLFDHSKYLYKTILFFSFFFFFFYIYFYLFFCNSCSLGLISLKKPFLMSVIFTGINKRVIKVFLTTKKTKNKTTTKQIAASTLWQGYCFWLKVTWYHSWKIYLTYVSQIIGQQVIYNSLNTDKSYLANTGNHFLELKVPHLPKPSCICKV